MMIVDPHDITKYTRNDYQLEAFLMFCVAVAGKSAVPTARKLDRFIYNLSYNDKYETVGTPFERVKRLLIKEKEDKTDYLTYEMRQVKLGKYSLLYKSYAYMARNCYNHDFDLRTCSIEQLEKIPGIGPKSARYFILHSRPNQRIAVIDTHILKFLKKTFPDEQIPKATPSSMKSYQKLENLFLTAYDDYRVVCGYDLTVADFDLDIWKSYTRGGKDNVG